MSQPYEVERWACAQTVGEPLGKLLLILMSIDANQQGYGWTSQRVLGKRAESCRQTVNSKFQELEKTGLIATRPRKRANGGDTSKEWMLLFKDDMECPDGTPVERHPLSSGTTPPCRELDDTPLSPQGRHHEETEGRDSLEQPNNFTTTTGEAQSETVNQRRLREFVDARIKVHQPKAAFRAKDLGSSKSRMARAPGEPPADRRGMAAGHEPVL